ncbi:MAG: IRE (iron responsive element), partial [Thermogutta sp.]|nr:IRE (iron responsive element) [Thermogutta sp.]
MTSRQQFLRKIVYLVIMAVLLGVLAYLGTPAAPSRDPQRSSPGGVLAQVREKEGLTPTQLGQLDPSGEAIKLATLGMRGVAVHILWMKAEDYKRRKDWTNLSATLEQMVKLEPHFV